jgi:hypothetical protein
MAMAEAPVGLRLGFMQRQDLLYGFEVEPHFFADDDVGTVTAFETQPL